METLQPDNSRCEYWRKETVHAVANLCDCGKYEGNPHLYITFVNNNTRRGPFSTVFEALRSILETFVGEVKNRVVRLDKDEAVKIGQWILGLKALPYGKGADAAGLKVELKNELTRFPGEQNACLNKLAEAMFEPILEEEQAVSFDKMPAQRQGNGSNQKLRLVTTPKS